MALKHYEELIAWQKAMDLVEMVYRYTIDFPKEETFGLTCQARRAAVSVASNMAEGQGAGQLANSFSSYLLPVVRSRKPRRSCYWLSAWVISVKQNRRKCEA
jgi:hypothetical protein